MSVWDERADAIRLEPPGEEGSGVEFWLRRGAIHEYHQVKRQHGAEGRWTMTTERPRAFSAVELMDMEFSPVRWVIDGVLPEGLAALRAARANRLQTSLNLALGSALATIGLTMPIVKFTLPARETTPS